MQRSWRERTGLNVDQLRLKLHLKLSYIDFGLQAMLDTRLVSRLDARVDARLEAVLEASVCLGAVYEVS